MVADKIVNLIDEDELARIETAAISHYSETEQQVFDTNRQQALLTELSHSNWKHRLKAFQQLGVDLAKL